MQPVVLLALPLSALVLTLALTGVFRRYALSRQLIDTPNDRSSHHKPTPRGGGMAIVVTVLAALPVLSAAGVMLPRAAVALGGAGALAAFSGFLDDHGHTPVVRRLAFHLLAATWGVFWLDGLPPVTLWLTPLDLGLAGDVVAIVGLVWLLNLYNFMDGINGIASIELISVTLGAIIAIGVSGNASELLLPSILFAAGLGFLPWNFPRARIFMGDSCSGFLGITLGLIALWQSKAAPEMLAMWLTLLGVFIVDATFTLLRRLIRGDRFYQAHRTHAYQLAARHVGSHTPVTSTVAVINLCWLTPVATLVLSSAAPTLVLVATAWAPLVALELYWKAGKPESRTGV